jgi:hypothetical protein
MPTVTPQALTRTVQDFLSRGRRRSGAGKRRCRLSIWRNPSTPFRASTTDACCTCGRRSETPCGVCWMLKSRMARLRLAVQRLGQARPSKLEICRERDRRTPTARRAARAAYEQKLRRSLERHFPDFKIVRLTSGVDLEKSFGPIYARGFCGRDALLSRCSG